MNPRLLLQLALGAALLALPLSSAQADELFAISGAGHTPSILYKVDPGTGAILDTIGDTGVVDPVHITSLAFHPTTGVLYAYMNEAVSYNEGTLATIDLNTGLATPVGVSTPLHVPDITFNSSGTLYAWTEGGTWFDDLVELDPGTGGVTHIGGDIGTFQTGLGCNSAGTLYLKSGSDVYTLNTGTGSGTYLISLTASLDNTLAFDSSDNAYGIDRTGGTTILVTIDLGSGLVTTVGDMGTPNIAALAFRSEGPTATEKTTWGQLKQLHK